MMKKYRMQLMLLAGIVFICVITLVVGNTLAYTGGGFLKNQKVDGLSFENAQMKYKDGKTTFTVEVYNETNRTYNLKNISIEIENYENEKVTLTNEIDSLVPNEGKLIRITVDKDITKLTSLKYIINK